MVIYIQERAPTGLTRKIPASTAFSFFSQANTKMQLGNLGVVDMVPKLALSEAQIDTYLSTPPLGRLKVVYRLSSQNQNGSVAVHGNWNYELSLGNCTCVHLLQRYDTEGRCVHTQGLTFKLDCKSKAS